LAVITEDHYNYGCIIKFSPLKERLSSEYALQSWFRMIRNCFVLLTIIYRTSFEAYRAKFDKI